MRRLKAGAKVRFFHDHYGQQGIEISRGWLLGRRRILLSADDVLTIKQALGAERGTDRI
jgi:hypothetical protein